MQISIIGSGNVAWHLAQVFEDCGHSICEIYSRKLGNAKILVSKLFDAKAVDDLDFSDSKAELFVLAVTDGAYDDILDQLILPDNAILVHTSGAIPLSILKDWLNTSENEVTVGVFYPLMTFTKGKKLNFKEIPLCLEALDEVTENILINLGQAISNIVYLVDSDERKILHVAAVIANNFVNHLLAISQDLLIENDLEIKLLKPIIRETIEKAFVADDIHDVQTGPAIRGDEKTIKEHISLLKAYPQTEKIYRVLSESIFNQFNP